MAGDQAAGLRAWAASLERPAAEAGSDPVPEPATAVTSDTGASDIGASRIESVEAPLTTLMVVGLPSTAPEQAERVTALLDHWAERGRRWVGDPRGWKVVPLAASSPHLAVLAQEQPRWALWVGPDGEAFRRALGVLGRLAEGGGPRRLIAVHPPGMPRRGLLDNLCQAARHYFGIDLLVVA
ncbi:hypothetical protein [Halomonas getboli]|uniref:hypothetical protein n=1 Tax=Halomonas getboli TaxID=2935862 RepID=UPI001FFF0723|nr:hypothetical protein [Halomonas getboli]MCK2185133.1 hypothetical protein [Halomonas getboli]